MVPLGHTHRARHAAGAAAAAVDRVRAAAAAAASGLCCIAVRLLQTSDSLLVSSTPFTDAIAQLLLFFAGTYKDVFGFADPPLHDPCAVAYVAAPELFETVFVNVSVITGESLAAGRTVWYVQFAVCFVLS